MPHPAPIAVDDPGQFGQAPLDFQELVDLLLVFRHYVLDIALLKDLRDFSDGGILVESDGDGAGRLGGDFRVEGSWPVVAEDGYLVPLGEPEGGQSQGKEFDVIVVLLPRI